jgi:uncharacterized protein YegL
MAHSQNVGNDEGMESFGLGGGFGFTGVGMERLGATEYTLVTMLVDVTGSTEGFAADLRTALVTAVEACKKSPRSDNLLVRVVTFSTSVGPANELHGFKPLSEITVDDYPQFRPGGSTPLYDAAHLAVKAMVDYGKTLTEQDFLVNGIFFHITDGEEYPAGCSTATPAMVKKLMQQATSGEELESLVSILIGINASQCLAALQTFQKAAGFTQFIDCGEATKGTLAKLADFVSQSVSSQSQSLGTGGPSQNIAATI